MKLHSDTLTVEDINTALRLAKDAGNVDKAVVFDVLECKGSRSRKNGFEIKLEWIGEKVKGDGRRWTNGGSYGANSYDNGNGTYAATRDEWGYFIAELYTLDPELIFGYYKSRDEFNTYTRNAYV